MSYLRRDINSTPSSASHDSRMTLHPTAYSSLHGRSRSPIGPYPARSNGKTSVANEGDPIVLEDPRMSIFKELYLKSEARLASLLDGGKQATSDNQDHVSEAEAQSAPESEKPAQPKPLIPAKRPARAIDEDNYDDEEDEDEDECNRMSPQVSPLKSKSTCGPVPSLLSSVSMARSQSSTSISVAQNSVNASPTKIAKSADDIRKQLAEDKKASEDAAKQSFHQFFFTLENDKDAMLDQKKLEESERQVDLEIGNQRGTVASSTGAAPGPQYATLSQTNLGASNLTLKHLIASIDAKREVVHASDLELRSLISEVRKNRSKWANEDRVGQEELYEAAEKVLTDLKASSHAFPFQNRVNKKDAPDYHAVIKNPMDLMTMLKKLKNFSYKSKQDFVDDLNLIWANCLRYNASPEHPLRRHALAMRKKTDQLVPLIPNIVIKDRAEVEAEERRLQNGGADGDAGDDSDDEPIIASRGRGVPAKTAKKGSNTRNAASSSRHGSPAIDTKPTLASRTEHLRESSEHRADSVQNEFSTPPPPGTLTPAGINGVSGETQSVHSDAMDVDGGDVLVNGLNQPGSRLDDVAHDDAEFETWKQLTKRDRAQLTAERHRLFKGEAINAEEPALLRSRTGMRRWLNKQEGNITQESNATKDLDPHATSKEIPTGGVETLAEEIEGNEDRLVPDYYDPMAGIPYLSKGTEWKEDNEGKVQDPIEDHLHVIKAGYFKQPDSRLTRKMDENLRQVQATRKVCTKIGVVKQMQVQAQMYHGQFQKHDPPPLVEQDVQPHVMSDEGPIASPWVCRAAMQRSIGKLLFNTGFEEFQPSAIDAFTDVAGEFMQNLASTLKAYKTAYQEPVPPAVPNENGKVKATWRPRFSTEESILHSLHESGLDLESLESYAKEDFERNLSKHTALNDRMKSHLAELLRPALSDGTVDGSGAFNDGSEQFVGGDFAEDLDEDFFGFRELGLDKELGLGSLSVPLHLLQSRMRAQNQVQDPNAASTSETSIFIPTPGSLPALTLDSLKPHIGLVQNFFLAKLHAQNDAPLVEDEDLPQKQRYPKPRLPPSGKISSPRKKVVKEPGPGKGHPRKKIKLMEEEREKEKQAAEEAKRRKEEEAAAEDVADTQMKDMDEVNDVHKGKELLSKARVEETGGMISPESLEAT